MTHCVECVSGEVGCGTCQTNSLFEALTDFEMFDAAERHAIEVFNQAGFEMVPLAPPDSIGGSPGGPAVVVPDVSAVPLFDIPAVAAPAMSGVVPTRVPAGAASSTVRRRTIGRSRRPARI